MIQEDELEVFAQEQTQKLYVHPQETKEMNKQCAHCQRTYHQVENKEQIINLLETSIDVNKPFTTEIAKVRYYMNLPCDEYSYFDMNNHICFMCYEKSKKCNLTPFQRKSTIPLILFIVVVIITFIILFATQEN